MMSARGRDKFAKVKWLLIFLSKIYSVFPLKIRKRLFEHHRTTKGMRGIAIRYALLKAIAQKCGDNVSIHTDCYLFSPEKMEIGNNVSIHPMCYIDATGGISIGNDVSIAHAVTIMTTNHRFDSHNIPIKDQPLEITKTEIGDNVWIGAKATILCGNNIGTGVVVGAGAVVTHEVPANTVNVGVPARVVKER